MKINPKFVAYIEKNCKANELTTGLSCIHCGFPVHIDWFEQELECTGCDIL